MLYNVNLTKTIEKKLIKLGHKEMSLMFKAGNAVFKSFENYNIKNVLVFAGPGNNGGDAFAFAILAYVNNYNVKCITIGKNKNHESELRDLVRKLNIPIDNRLPTIFHSNKTIIVDGLLGIGISRKPEGQILETINWINSHKKKSKVISIDVPSGLDANNGISIGQTVKADTTVMCLTKKQGCYTGDGVKCSGNLIYDNLGIQNIRNLVDSNVSLISTEQYKPIKRNKTSHKGNFGNLLIIGGWDGMLGAANLCGLAALRTGVGKVYLCSNNEIKRSNEIISVPTCLSQLKKLINKTQAAVIGPGLGQNAHDIINFLWNSKKPLVIDADGLNWVSKYFLKKRKATTIFTPHHGEAAKLIKKEIVNRFKTINELKKKYGGIWILKGPGTIVLNSKININDFSNSILSTGGTGDVLSGIIGSLLSQKISLPEIKGVLIHTLCAKNVLNKNRKTLLASDLVKEISSVI